MKAKNTALAVEAGLALVLGAMLALSGGVANAMVPAAGQPTVGGQSLPVGAASAPVGLSSAPTGG